jgi:hypothetical protein
MLRSINRIAKQSTRYAALSCACRLVATQAMIPLSSPVGRPTMILRQLIEQFSTVKSRNQVMHGASRIYLAVCFFILISGCGGGNNPATPMSPPPANFDLQAGMAKMVANGLSSNVALSGTVSVNGGSTAFTGSGTFTRPPAVSATFDGSAALSQTTTVAGSITAAGQTSPYSTSVTDYYASSDSAFLGEVFASEYDVAQAPISFPTSVTGGSSGTLGTLSRYTDSTMSISLGTAQMSYSLLAPVDPGSPIGIVVTTKIFDTQNTLIETDVTNYTMTTSDVVSLSGASAQNQSGMLKVTVQ